MDGGHPPPAAGLPMDGGRACIECRRSMTTTHLRKAASPWMEVTRRPPPAVPMDGGRACIECRRSMTTTHLRKAASPWMEVARRPPPASPWMEVARAPPHTETPRHPSAP